MKRVRATARKLSETRDGGGEAEILYQYRLERHRATKSEVESKDEDSDRGHTMVFHEPAFGIWLFMVSLFFICLHELDTLNNHYALL